MFALTAASISIGLGAQMENRRLPSARPKIQMRRYEVAFGRERRWWRAARMRNTALDVRS